MERSTKNMLLSNFLAVSFSIIALKVTTMYTQNRGSYKRCPSQFIRAGENHSVSQRDI